MSHSSSLRLAWTTRWLAVWAVLCATSLALAQQLPTPQLTSVFPAGAKVGSTVEVTVVGNDLDDANQILFSHPGITAALKPKAAEQPMPSPSGRMKRGKMNAATSSTTFVVTVAGSVAPGIYEARVQGRFGVSNPRAFVVGNLDEVLEAAGNNASGTAQEVAVGQVLSGRADQNSKDYYKLNLKQGQRVIFDCVAQRIDSRMDGTLALFNSQGRELVRNRDTSGSDPVIDFTAPAEGAYTLAVYDFTYGGGVEHGYRLQVHSAPLVDFVFPPAGAPGSQGPFTLYGRNLPGGQPTEIKLAGVPLEKLDVNIPVPSDPTARQQLAVGSLVLPRSSFVDSFEYRLPSPQGAANPVSIGIAEQPLVIEQAANDTPDKAQAIQFPCEVVGQFYPARDRDYFQFTAKKGDVLNIEVLAHRLGYDSDPALLVQRVTKNDKGEEVVSDVATVDDPQERQNRIGSDFDTSTDDPSYQLKVTEDATYRLLVRDNFGESRSDPRYVYRLIVRPEQPDYRVAVYLDAFAPQQNQNQISIVGPVLRRGGTLELKVNLDRRDGFAGEVAISVEGLPAGVTCPGALLGGSNERASLVFTAADNAAPWAGPVRIVGKATINGQEVVREARIGTVVWGTPDRNQRPAEYRLSRDFVLAVIDKELQPALVQLGEEKVYETSLGGNLEMPVKVTRREGCADSIKLTKTGLPNEINVKEINIGGGANDGKLEMQLNQQNIKPGVYTFVMRGETKIKYARNPDAIKAVEAEQAAFGEMQKQLADELNKSNNDKNTTAQQAQQAVNERNQAQQNKDNTAGQAKQAADQAKAAADKAAQAKEAAAKDAANASLTEAANAAQKTAEEAAAKSTAATEAAANAEKALAAAQDKVKAMEEARAKAEQMAKEVQDDINTANQEKQKLDQRVNEVKNLNQPKDMQVIFASLPVKVRIVASPLKLTTEQPTPTVKQGEKLELPVAIERMYGFAEGVEVQLETPGVGGISVQKADIAKDQPQGKLVINANKDAAPGEHAVTLRARARFNNVPIETSLPIVLKIEKVENK